jgi:hypothetical protein
MRLFIVTAIACTAAFSAAASAEIIAFTNPDGPGRFEWAQSFDGSINFNTGLDITVSAADQSIFGNPAISSFQQYYDSSTGSNSFLATSAGDGNMILTDPLALTLALQEGEFAATSGGIWTQGFSVVDEPGFGSINLADGESGYVMVQFAASGSFGDFHHGWIGVTREGSFLDAFAWGYETEFNTPIAAGAGIPGPAGIATFAAFGLLGGRRRRR